MFESAKSDHWYGIQFKNDEQTLKENNGKMVVVVLDSWHKRIKYVPPLFNSIMSGEGLKNLYAIWKDRVVFQNVAKV